MRVHGERRAALPAGTHAAVPTAYERARVTAARAQALGIRAEEVPILVPLEVGGVVITVGGEAGHPVTTLRRAGVAVEVIGEPVDVVADGGDLVALRTERGCAIVDLGAARILAAFAPTSDAVAGARLAVRGDAAVVTEVLRRDPPGGVLHYVSRGGAWVRVPVPSTPTSIALTDTHVVMTCQTLTRQHGERLEVNETVTLSRAELAAQMGDVALELAPLADASADDDECLVRSVVTRFVSLTERRSGRMFNFRCADAAEAARFAKGETVYIVDDRLVKAAERAAGAGTPAPLVVEASALPPRAPMMDPETRAPAAPAPAGLAVLAALGYSPSPLLVQMVTRSAWCWPLGVFEPREGAANVGVPIDPSFVTLFDDGDGNQTGLYVYPPAGGPPALVHFQHDEPGLTWLGATFETALVRVLQAPVAEQVLVLLRRLGLFVTFLDEHPADVAPAWFTAAHGVTRGGLAGEALIAAAAAEPDRIAAERMYVRALHQVYEPGPRARVVAALRVLYGELGWTAHARRC